MQATSEKTSINPTDHPVHSLIADRWSPRAFGEQLVDAAALRSLLEAARWAPSAANMQPWHFIVATKDDAEAHARIVSTLMEGNIRWAQHAPVLMLVVVKQYVDANGNPTGRSLYDAGLAVGALTFEAGARGLALHQMGGFYADKVRETFAVPEGFEPVAAIAIGFTGDPASLPDDLRERENAPRTRKALSEFVFGDKWGKPADLGRP